jgi:hypothetical protein
LFLGLGLIERSGLRLSLLIGLSFLALVLAGAPLTSGAMAKSALSDSLSPAAPVLVTLLAASTLATTLLMTRFMFLLWTRRRREIVPLPGIPFSAWLCLVAVILVLPFLLADIGRSMTTVVPVSLGLLLGLVGILAGSSVYAVLIGDPKRAGTQALSARLRAALLHTLHKARLDIDLQDSARARVVTAYRRQAGEWLARLQCITESARRPLTGALWLGIAGGLMGAFVIAK